MADDTPTTPADVTAVDDDTLGTEHAALTERINGLRPKVADRSLTPDELTQLQADTERFATVNGEVQARQERQNAAYASLDEGLAAVPEPTAATEQPADAAGAATAGGDGAGGAEAGGEATPTEDTGQASSSTSTTQATPAPVAAAGNPPMGTVSRQAVAGGNAAQPGRREPQRTAIAITAAADVQGFSAGQQLQTEQLGRAFGNRLRAVTAAAGARRRMGTGTADGEFVPVATLTAAGVPDDQWLRKGDEIGNTRKINQVTSRRALVAAGGWCAPFAIDYSYGTIGVKGRPLRDSLPSFPAERGGIQYRRDLSPATDKADDGPRAATGHWTADDDAAASSPSATKRKAYWVAGCPETETAEVEAITLQAEFENWAKFDPETLQNNQEAMLIWHDRHCETWLWAKLAELCKLMTQKKVLGATRDLLTTLDQLQAYTRSVHRLSDDIPLEVPMQTWMRAMIRADMTRAMSMGTDTLNVTNAMIDAWLASRGLSPVWLLDGADEDEVVGGTGGVSVAAQQYSLLPDQAKGVPVPVFPAQVDLLMYPRGHFQHLDGGTLDLGIVRDSELIERNRYREFSETWEGVADRGVEAIRLVADVVPDGGMSGTVDPADVAANPAVIGA